MSRPLRIYYPGAWYHIMNRGSARKNTFMRDEHREIFVDLLMEITGRYKVEIHAYCLMDNHYHLLIKTPLGNISRSMQHLDGVYTQRFNKLMKRDGSLFRGRFKSILIDADTYLLQVSRYIHLNPVEGMIVKKAEQYRWSSYKNYISDINTDWLHTNHILSHFGSEQTRMKYKTFVDEGVDEKIATFYKKINKSPVLGDDIFIKNVARKHLKEKHRINDIPEHKVLDLIGRVSIDRIIECVESYYQVNNTSVLCANKKGSNLPRIIGIYLSQRVGHYSSSQIAAIFGNMSPDGVLKLCKRTHLKIDSDYMLKVDVDELIRCLIG